MQKFFLKPQLDELKLLKTKTLNAEEDVKWYRLQKQMIDAILALQKETEDLGVQAKESGVVFMEDGHPDVEKSDAEALKKANDKMNVIYNEDIPLNVLPIELLNKLKVENDIEGEKYFIMLNRFLKD